jgi:excisionase family DNA binding protein
MGDLYFTLREAAKMSGYHPDYIGSLVRKKKIKGKKIGRSWVIDRPSFEAFLGVSKTPRFLVNTAFFKTTLSFVFLFALIGLTTIVFLGGSVLKDGFGSKKQISENVVKTLDDNSEAVPVPLQ